MNLVFEAYYIILKISLPNVQEVVASIASDKNVWDAVMKNQKVLDFYKTHQTGKPEEEYFLALFPIKFC